MINGVQEPRRDDYDNRVKKLCIVFFKFYYFYLFQSRPRVKLIRQTFIKFINAESVFINIISFFFTNVYRVLYKDRLALVRLYSCILRVHSARALLLLLFRTRAKNGAYTLYAAACIYIRQKELFYIFYIYKREV